MFEVDFLNRIIEYTVLTTKMEVIHRKQSSAGVTGLLTLEDYWAKNAVESNKYNFVHFINSTYKV